MSDSDWLKNQLNKIEHKIDGLDTRLDGVDITLTKQSMILDEHQRRSLANEEQVELLKQKLNSEIDPLKTHVSNVNLILRLAGIAASAIGVGLTVLEVLSLLKN